MFTQGLDNCTQWSLVFSGLSSPGAQCPNTTSDFAVMSSPSDEKGYNQPFHVAGSNHSAPNEI